jgi:hypothetical protein
MVETITPVVHGGRRNRWALLLVMHVAGATVAAAAFGALLGGAGALLGAPWGGAGLAAVAALAGVYLLREALRVPVPVPQLRRQVPDWWRTFFPFGPAAFLYGLGLGVGFLTYLSHGTFVVVAAAAAAGGGPLLGAALLAPFGLARGLSAAVAVRTRTPEDGSVLVDRLADAASWPGWRWGHGLALGAIAVLGVVAATGSRTTSATAGDLAAAGIAVAFGAAGVAKLVRPRVWRSALAAYRLPAGVERSARVGVPAVEAAIAVLALLGLPRTAGAASAAVLLAFSGAIVVARARVGRRLDCGCFGTRTTRDYRLLLARNAGLAVLAALAWAYGVDAPLGGSVGPPAAHDALPLGLAAVGVVVIGWVAFSAFGAVRRVSADRRGDPR